MEAKIITVTASESQWCNLTNQEVKEYKYCSASFYRSPTFVEDPTIANLMQAFKDSYEELARCSPDALRRIQKKHMNVILHFEEYRE